MNDLTGKRFGRWTVTKRAPNRKLATYYLCKCDCGVEKEVCSSHLKRGKSTSCGCYQRELIVALGRKIPSEETKKKMRNIKLGKSHPSKPLFDLTGIRFGRWVVLDRVFIYNRLYWLCKCDCGKIKEIRGDALRKGKSLGCKSCSARENATKSWEDPEFVKKQMRANKVQPNKYELKFESFLSFNFPNEWKYVGDGQLIIAGKCPDFVNVNGKKQIIELYGDYWHKGQNPQDRINLFSRLGFKTLIIWASEMRDIERVKEKIYGEFY